MDAILGNGPATKPPVVIDTSSAPVIDNLEEQQDQDKPERDDSESLSTSSSTASLVPSSSSVKRVWKNPRKGKRSMKSDNESVMKAQSKSDEKMLELEEKRLRMEERQLEREAQIRRR